VQDKKNCITSSKAKLTAVSIAVRQAEKPLIII
jgi:hypothetical protein